MKKVFDKNGKLKYFETKIISKNRITLPKEAMEFIGNQKEIEIKLVKDGKVVGGFVAKNRIPR